MEKQRKTDKKEWNRKKSRKEKAEGDMRSHTPIQRKNRRDEQITRTEIIKYSASDHGGRKIPQKTITTRIAELYRML